jgi:hypothetical protein
MVGYLTDETRRQMVAAFVADAALSELSAGDREALAESGLLTAGLC